MPQRDVIPTRVLAETLLGIHRDRAVGVERPPANVFQACLGRPPRMENGSSCLAIVDERAGLSLDSSLFFEGQGRD